MDSKNEICEYLKKDLTSKYKRKLLGIIDEEQNGDIGVGCGDILFLNHVISENPSLNNFVELGTWTGVTSMYLGMIARIRGGEFHSFDKVDVRMESVKNSWLPEMYFHQEDILRKKPSKKVLDLVSKENTFIFVDNGDKIKEITLYCGNLIPKSVFVVHDWGDEINIENMNCMKNFVEFSQINEETAQILCSSCRAWIKNETIS